MTERIKLLLVKLKSVLYANVQMSMHRNHGITSQTVNFQ